MRAPVHDVRVLTEDLSCHWQGRCFARHCQWVGPLQRLRTFAETDALGHKLNISPLGALHVMAGKEQPS